jgi:hypothetical protein
MVTSIILIVASFGLLIAGSISYFHLIDLLKKGVTTEGIIFNVEGRDSFNNVLLSYPTVRFLTVNNEWVTETSKIGLMPGYYKKGKKVTVIYKSEDPKQFVIKSDYNKVIPVIVIAAGAILLLIAILNLLHI